MIIRHAKGSYAVECVGYDDALSRLPQGCAIITDSNVAHHWETAPRGTLSTQSLVPGEREKTLTTFEQILEGLAHGRASRSTPVVASASPASVKLGGRKSR